MALSPEVVQQVVADVMASARAFWIKAAGEKLHSSSRDYIAGIQEVMQDEEGASITLVGAWPVMLEEGTGPYDMHDTLLGPNVPVANGPGEKGKHRLKNGGGYWRVIPMRHQTPGSAGVGGGAPMGSAYFKSLPQSLGDTLRSDLGSAIHRAAKRLKPTTSTPGGGTSWGGRLPAGVGGVQKLKPHHSTDIYAGMVRSSKTYGKATQNTYTTFRVISDAVPGAWLHPGVPAANLLDDVAAHVARIAPLAFHALVAG